MKEETLIIMKNKVESLTRVVQHLLTEVTNLRELGIGTLETLKLTPDYDKALEQLLMKEKEKEKAPKLE